MSTFSLVCCCLLAWLTGSQRNCTSLTSQVSQTGLDLLKRLHFLFQRLLMLLGRLPVIKQRRVLRDGSLWRVFFGRTVGEHSSAFAIWLSLLVLDSR